MIGVPVATPTGGRGPVGVGLGRGRPGGQEKGTDRVPSGRRVLETNEQDKRRCGTTGRILGRVSLSTPTVRIGRRRSLSPGRVVPDPPQVWGVGAAKESTFKTNRTTVVTTVVRDDGWKGTGVWFVTGEGRKVHGTPETKQGRRWFVPGS